jgi:hypothetical protein
MPGFDGTGPQGYGPMTGGGRGFCAVPFQGEFRRFYPGKFGGRGRGRGFRYWYRATGLPGWLRAGGVSQFTAQEESQLLKEQANALKEELQNIENRISALEQEKKEGE